ncbi:MAG: helix-turn-helix transcriptional regulator [Candidatus Velthaea sp.]
MNIEAGDVPERLSGALTADSLTFVRGGALRASLRGAALRIVDANHVILGRPAVDFTAVSPNVRCTVVRFAGFGPGPGHEIGIRLCPSAMYLAHWMLLDRAGDRMHAAAQLEGAARDVARVCRVASISEHARRVGVYVSSALHEAGNRRLSLDALAASLSLSRFTVSHLFSEYAGITLRLYHRRLRMRLALELLREAPVQLTALALELGFSDQAHFSNTFHAEYGIAPSLLRGNAALSRAMIRKRRVALLPRMETP